MSTVNVTVSFSETKQSGKFDQLEEWFYLTRETLSNNSCLMVKVEQYKIMELFCNIGGA